MVNPAGKIERLMVHKPNERFMVYDSPLCVIIAPNEDGSLRIDAFGGEETHEQGIDDRILHDPRAPHTELIFHLARILLEAKAKEETAIGDTITPLLYPEIGIEYAYALKSKCRIGEKDFMQMLGLSRGLQIARNVEAEYAKKENLRRRKEIQRLSQY